MGYSVERYLVVSGQGVDEALEEALTRFEYDSVMERRVNGRLRWFVVLGHGWKESVQADKEEVAAFESLINWLPGTMERQRWVEWHLVTLGEDIDDTAIDRGFLTNRERIASNMRRSRE